MLFAQLGDIGDAWMWMACGILGFASPFIGYVANWLWRRPSFNRRRWKIVIADYGALVILPGFVFALYEVFHIGPSDGFVLPFIALLLAGPLLGIAFALGRPIKRQTPKTK